MNVDTAWEGWTKPIRDLIHLQDKQKEKQQYGADKRDFNRLAQKRRFLEKGLEKLAETSPALYSGKDDVALTQPKVNALFDQVCGDLAGHERRGVHNYLVKGLAQGIGDLGWDMPVPAPIAVMSVEPSNATPEIARLWAQFDDLKDAFSKHLQHHRDSKEFEDEAGELLLSACLDSGIIHKRWLNLLPEAIRLGAGSHDGLVWLDLGTAHNLENSDYEEERRRVFLSPTTQILLWRWYQRWGKTWPQDPQTKKYQQTDVLVRKFAKKLCVNAGLDPDIASRYLLLSRANLVSAIPNCLVHYLSSRRVGPSLMDHDWVRLVTGQSVTANEVEEVEAAPVEARDSLNVTGKFPDQEPLFSELRSAISENARSGSLAFIEKFVCRADVSPLLQLMAHWAGHLVRHGGMAKKDLKSSSVVRYLNWIKKLLDYTEDLTDPLNLDEDSWQEIYDELLANSHGVVADRAGRLAAFHDYIRRAFGVPPVDVAGMSADRQVDARILTPREYQQVRLRLRKIASVDSLAEVQEILLIMGYRLGLRRGEAFSRQFSDFSGFEDDTVSKVELLVRTNKRARIKSSTSTRRLPLWLLLTHEELATLREFYRRQKNLLPGNANGKPLFGSLIGSSWEAVETRVYEPLTAELQAVTGYSRFRFHHLRHSFVTFTGLRLFERKPMEFIPASWRQGDAGEDWLPCVDQCLWQQVGLKEPGQALWLLALWAGHASPQVTLECYSHLLDWLVRCHLWRVSDPGLSSISQQVLLDKSAAALEKYRSRHSISGMPTAASLIASVVTESWPVKGRKPLLPVENNLEEPEQAIAQTARTDFLLPYRLVLMAAELINDAGAVKPRGLNSAADILGIPIENAEGWDRVCGWAMSLTTNRPRQGASASGLVAQKPRPKLSRETPDVLRELYQKDPSKRLPEVPGRFLAPPNTPTTLTYADKYFGALYDWFEKEPEDALLCMRAALECAQRSHPEMRPRGISRQQLFVRLLSELELKSRIQVSINVSPKAEKDQVKQYWGELFHMQPRQIRCHVDRTGKKLGRYGRCHLAVDSPSALHVNQNLFWSTFRFALYSAYVVCQAELESQKK